MSLTGAATRNIFKRCHFRTYTSLTTFNVVKIAAAMDRFTLFENCLFTAAANITSAAAPTGCFDANAVNGEVLILNPMLSGIVQITTADASRVKVLGLNGLATGHLIGISQGVDAT